MTSDSSTVVIHPEFVHITPDHDTDLCSRLYQQWRENQHCDLIISLKGGELRAHSCILAAFSPKLKSILDDSIQYTQGASGMLIQLTFEDSVFECLLNMMYTGVLSFNTAMLSSVLSTARWMQMDDVVKLCQDYKESVGSHSNDALLTDDTVLCEVDAEDVVELGVQEVLPETPNGKKEPKPAVKAPRRKGRKRKRPASSLSNSRVSNQNKKNNNADNLSTIVQEVEIVNIEEGMNAIPVEETNSTHLDSTEAANFSTSLPKRMGQEQKSKKSEPKNPKHNPQKILDTDYTELDILDVEIKCERNSPEHETDASIMSQMEWVEVPTIENRSKEEEDFAMGKIEQIKCKRCAQKFTELDKYICHVTNHPTFTCEECGDRYFRQSNLTRHMRMIHPADNYIKCKKCGFIASTERMLRTHFKEVHQDDNPFMCDYPECKFSTWKSDFLRRHAEIHSEVKGYICNKCGQGFSQHAGLMSHERACYHLQQYLCDICGQSFNHPQSMRAHRRTIHFGEKPFVCKVCGNQFSDQRNLKRHMRIHENIFPYHCPICKQRFRHSNSLKAHLSKHGDAGSDMNFSGLIKEQSAEWAKKTTPGQKRKKTAKNVNSTDIRIHLEDVVLNGTLHSVDSVAGVVFSQEVTSNTATASQEENEPVAVSD